jgi:hypothetical protein
MHQNTLWNGQSGQFVAKQRRQPAQRAQRKRKEEDKMAKTKWIAQKAPSLHGARGAAWFASAAKATWAFRWKNVGFAFLWLIAMNVANAFDNALRMSVGGLGGMVGGALLAAALLALWPAWAIGGARGAQAASAGLFVKWGRLFSGFSWPEILGSWGIGALGVVALVLVSLASSAIGGQIINGAIASHASEGMVGLALGAKLLIDAALFYAVFGVFWMAVGLRSRGAGALDALRVGAKAFAKNIWPVAAFLIVWALCVGVLLAVVVLLFKQSEILRFMASQTKTPSLGLGARAALTLVAQLGCIGALMTLIGMVWGASAIATEQTARAEDPAQAEPAAPAASNEGNPPAA